MIRHVRSPLRLAVVYATVGRAAVLLENVTRLVAQTRSADLVVVSAAEPSDAAGIDAAPITVETVYGPKGLCRQRNCALEHIAGRADIVLFLDDDFVPADDYLAAMMQVFETHPEVAGATGRIIADGINTPGYSVAQAVAMIAGDPPPPQVRLTPRTTLYGCNMALRLATLGELRFDERLPLYGWLEDIDLTYRLSRRGTLISTEAIAGVHLGVKGGRTSGVRLGYSQIANPLYMLRRGTIPRGMAWERMTRNLAANVVRSVRPEPYVDRIGRLRGNLRAIADALTGRIDPERVLTIT